MEINAVCLDCLYNKQVEDCNDDEYKKEIRQVLKKRTSNDTSPYMVYLFDQVYEKRYGKKNPKHVGFQKLNKHYNDLVLSMEDSIVKRIQQSSDPIHTALFLSRVGNYIDFGAMDHVDQNQFFDLLFKLDISEHDEATYQIFKEKCKEAKSLLILADNCGEIVLDKLFLQEFHKVYPNIELYIMVRGEEIQNDATRIDADYIHLDQAAHVIDNGNPIPGTVYSTLSNDVKKIVDDADIIISKGMGNYESASTIQKPIFYSFLCKCETFAHRFNVPLFTGMFIYEQ